MGVLLMSSILSIFMSINNIDMKDIKGFESYYSIDENGSIYCKGRTVQLVNGGTFKTLKKEKRSRINTHGYKITTLKKNGKAETHSVHRLVASHFIENPENKIQVNHIDGNKQNNHVSNLEWVTDSENKTHAVKLGLIKSKLKDEDVLKISESSLSNRKLAKIYGVNSSIIWRIKNKKAYKHLWQY